MDVRHTKPYGAQAGGSLTGTIRVEALDELTEKDRQRRGSLTVIRSGADLGVHGFVETPTILGRDPLCGFPLHDHRVSQQHAKLTPLGDDAFLLQDLGSTNGTRVNGTLITTPQLIHDGDKISIGETVLRFALADELDVDFQSEVAMLVSTDPLTGLPSKRRFDEALEFALQAAQRTGDSLAVLMMDMDGVKKINDTHGHLFGAHVIGETGRLIAEVLGPTGRACRFGGDEFSAFLPSHRLDAALHAAEQIRVKVENAGMQKDGIELKPTISIGVACYPEAGPRSLDLITTSDAALYRAKANGKNCVCT